ncbi:GNAT family N-acetyltransferase [Kribbella sp. NPDC049174]|uniref:GNAT family N-acetyltransferase n=1 Tax=Kribbella sp. NPDC049174 TaxID=3364112 RepID=UPI0037150C2F
MIRDRGEGDLESCIGFLRDVYEVAGYPINWPADPRAWLTPPEMLGAWVITTDDGRVAGHVALTAGADGTALVERLFVDPKATGGGLGRQLLEHAVVMGSELGRRVGLEVADNCHAAIGLYRRAGWRETGRTPIDWGTDQASAVLQFEPPA